MYKKILIIAVVGMILWGCEKEEEVLSERTQLIIGNFWKIKRIAGIEIVNGDTTKYPNVFSLTSSLDCIKKVALKFEKDGSLISDAGTTTCTLGAGTVSGQVKTNWSFQNEEKQISCRFCYNANCDIIKISSDSLIMKTQIIDAFPLTGQRGTFQYTWYFAK